MNSLILFEILIVGFANIPVLLVAKALNTTNAKYLIAGYNTMSDFDRGKIDAKRLVSSTKTFLHLLATVPFLAFVVLITTSKLEIAVGGYCLVVTVLICWFFVFTKKAGIR